MSLQEDVAAILETQIKTNEAFNIVMRHIAKRLLETPEGALDVDTMRELQLYATDFIHYYGHRIRDLAGRLRLLLEMVMAPDEDSNELKAIIRELEEVIPRV